MPWEIPITIEDTTYPVRFNTEAEPSQTDIDEAVAYIMQQRSAPAQPAPDQPGRLGSFASSVGRGALSVVPGTIGGVGYLTGSDTLTEAADTIEGGINRMLPVNPAYQEDLSMKIGSALGQAGGMLFTGGATGAAGKALALSRGIEAAQAAAKGTRLAQNVLTGTGVLQGTRGGGQAAEQYGMQGGTAYARALLGGAIEGLSERALFGMGTELAPVKKFLGDAAEKGVGGIVKAAGTEAGEEAAAQIGGNVATSVLAPYGVKTPGAFEGVGEAALLGGVAGGALGGVNALMQPSPTIEGEAMIPAEAPSAPVAPEQPETDELGVEAFRQEMVEIAQNPDPIEPLQNAVNKTAEASVAASANLLPATAAIIAAGGLKPAPVQEETPVGAQVAEQPASGVLLPQNTREQTIAQLRQQMRQRLSAEERAAMEEKLAQAEDEGVLADVFSEERKKAAAREDFLRRQQDLETERQRLEDAGILGDIFAEERQRALTREQPQPEPPVAEETAPPVEPIPAVEEAPAAPVAEEDKSDFAELQDLMSRRGQAQNKVKGISFSKKDEARFQELGAKLRRYLIESVDPATDPVVGEDINDQPIRQSAQGTFYTVENGRVRTGPAFKEVPAASIAEEQFPKVEIVVAPEGEAEVSLGMEEPPVEEKLMDVPQTMQFLYGLNLSKTDREKAQKLLEKNEREARKTGKIQGARSFYESDVTAAVEEVLAQKQDSAEFRKRLAAAKANRKFSQELDALVSALEVEEAQLQSIQSERGMFGVQWAERNVRTRATNQKKKIRDLKERIVSLAPSKIALQSQKGPTLPIASLVTIPEDMARAEQDKAENNERWQKSSTSREPISVLERLDGTYSVIDGHHRLLAAKDRGETDIPVVVTKETKLEPLKKTAPAKVEQPAPQRDTSKPEQMTPEEYVEAKKPELEDVAVLEREFNALPKDSNRRPRAERAIRSAREDNKAKEQRWEEDRGMWDRKHRRSIGDATEAQKPVSKAAVDAYGITLPEGYVAEGELYVYRPEGGKVEEAPAPMTPAYLEQVKKAQMPSIEEAETGIKARFEDAAGRALTADQIFGIAVAITKKLQAKGTQANIQDILDSATPAQIKAEVKEFGYTNTVVTKETKDAAAKNLRKKLGGQTNVGLDPSILKDAIAIGAFYIEGGARSFAEFSAKMIEDFGANVQKYIRPAYEALRKRTDIDTTGMSPEEGGEPTILPEYESRRKQFQRNVRGPESLADVPDYIQTFLGEVFGVPSTRSSFAGAKFDGQTPFSVQTTDRAEFTVRLGLTPQIQNAFETQDQEVFAELLLDTVTEEMIHLADFNALKEVWVSEGKPGDFNNWIASRSASTLTELQHAGFGDLVQSAWALYEDTNLANLSQKEIALLLSSNPFAAQGVVSKAARMAVQLRLNGDITETGWMKVKKVVNDWLADLLSGLKKALARSRDGGAKTLFQARIDSIEAEFSKFLKSSEPAPKSEEPKTPTPTNEPAAKTSLEDNADKVLPREPVPAAVQDKLRETPSEATEPAVVPIANDPVDAQRVALGLPPIMRQTQEAYTFPQMWSDAEAAMAANPERGKALVTELNDKPRTISALEDAILLRERVNRVNALDLAMVEFNKAPKGNNETQRKAMDTAITSLTELDEALNVAGTEQGRSLNARKMLARLDYSLPKMLTTLRAANDGNLSEADVAMVTRLQKQLEAAQKKIVEAESGQAARLAEAEKVAFEAGRQEVLKDIQDRAKVEAEKIAEMQKRRSEYQAAKKEAATKPNKWAEIREAARARNAELRSNLYSDVVLVKAASMAVNDVIIGATYIAEGVTKLADWVTSMRGEGYNLPDEEMEQLFNESKAFDAGEELPSADTPLKTNKAKAPVIERVQSIAADGEELDSRTVYNLVVEKMKARAEASQGAKLPEMSEADLTSVIREVTADVQAYFPDITEREIRDLFSGYGKILMPSQDELSKQVRQLSALGKLASAIEDAKAQIAPLKSGPQRDKATQAIRLQQKKLARELRMSGVEYAADEGQLRSPLDAIKARLNNQINDLALEINTRKKIQRRPSVDYDKETESLVSLRDDLKRISDEVNAPAGPTLEETVAEEMKKLDKRIEELRGLISEGQFKPKEDNLLHTAELDAKREVRDGLNKTLQKMRKEAADKSRTQEDIDKEAIASAQESIAELEKKIAAKDVSRPQRRTPTETAEYQALTARKKSLQQILSKLRESIEGKRGMSDEQRIKLATAAIDKSMARIQGMLTSGNYEVPKRVSKTPETPELKAKRDARDALRKQLIGLRKLKRDAAIDPIAKQIATDKKRIQTRMKKLKKRMDDGDFSKPVKKQRATDDALLKLQVEEEKLKEEWAKIVFERQLASRGPGKKILDATQQTLNTARAILTSVDVSAVLRQGGFIVLGNPLRGLRNLGPMFRAFGSDEFAKGEKFRLQNRENYKNGLYQQSKLFLADTSQVNQMSKQEEAFMTRWLEKIPRALGGGILRGSQRSYTVFLNRLRADSFDAMVANLKKGSEPTPQEVKAVADYINIATGRGDLGKFNQAGTMLNTVFFAPRLVASRFQILAGYPYFTASGRTKALVLREYAKFLTGAALVYALGMLAQDDEDEPIETDPRSSDFGKIRFGDTRVDPLSGLIQATVLLSRLATGEKKTANGKIVAIRGAEVPYGADSSFDVLANFGRTKLSPIVGSAVNVLEGKNVVGEPTDVTEELQRMVIPMSFTEMKETFEAQGVPEATALTILQLFGMGVQTYTPGKK
jgi:hypothetical protein